MKNKFLYSKTFINLIPSNFLTGISSIFNIFGISQVYKKYESPQEQDYESIKSDWDTIGGDLYNSIKNYKKGE